jgi:hypothetical protein
MCRSSWAGGVVDVAEVLRWLEVLRWYLKGIKNRHPDSFPSGLAGAVRATGCLFSFGLELDDLPDSHLILVCYNQKLDPQFPGQFLHQLPDPGPEFC